VLGGRGRECWPRVQPQALLGPGRARVVCGARLLLKVCVWVTSGGVRGPALPLSPRSPPPVPHHIFGTGVQCVRWACRGGVFVVGRGALLGRSPSQPCGFFRLARANFPVCVALRGSGARPALPLPCHPAIVLWLTRLGWLPGVSAARARALGGEGVGWVCVACLVEADPDGVPT
jgi:hypothetical protein